MISVRYATLRLGPRCFFQLQHPSQATCHTNCMRKRWKSIFQHGHLPCFVQTLKQGMHRFCLCYLFINLCIYLSIYMHMYRGIYVRIYESMYVQMYVCIKLSIYLCRHLGMYVCMYGSIYLCTNLYIYLCIYLSVSLSADISINSCVIYLHFFIFIIDYSITEFIFIPFFFFVYPTIDQSLRVVFPLFSIFFIMLANFIFTDSRFLVYVSLSVSLYFYVPLSLYSSVISLDISCHVSIGLSILFGYWRGEKPKISEIAGYNHRQLRSLS